MVVRRNEREPIKLIQRFYIMPVFNSIYFKKMKRDNNEIVQINF